MRVVDIVCLFLMLVLGLVVFVWLMALGFMGWAATWLISWGIANQGLAYWNVRRWTDHD